MSETEIHRELDDIKRQIEESQVANRNALGIWLTANWKAIAGVATALGIVGPGQLAAFTLPALETAQVKSAEATAARETLAMTGREWMAEIETARVAAKKEAEEHCDDLLRAHGVTP
jgi:hypothetical protein